MTYTHIAASCGLSSTALVENVHELGARQRGIEPSSFDLPRQKLPKTLLIWKRSPPQPGSCSVDDDPRPMSRDVLRRLLKRIGDRAGVSGVHPHRFRHTFAINYLRNGGSGFQIKQHDNGFPRWHRVCLWRRCFANRVDGLNSQHSCW